jgi:hypothetical protein
MATYSEKLADSLNILKDLQVNDRPVLRGNALSRTHLKRLVDGGYLQQIIKGWYMPGRPGEVVGDTTSWHASLREFIRGYCDERFGEEWYVNAETSLLLHTGSSTLPKQIFINARNGQNNSLALPAGSTLYD